MSSRSSTCLIRWLGLKAPPLLFSILTAAYCFNVALLHMLASTENTQAGESAAAQIWLPGYHRWLLYACHHISEINLPTSPCCLSAVKSAQGNALHITHATSTKCKYKENYGSFIWIMRGCILDTGVCVYILERCIHNMEVINNNYPHWLCRLQPSAC